MLIKKTLLTMMFVALLAQLACGQDTVRICDRLPNYLYGNMWVDQYSHFCGGNCDLRHCTWPSHRTPSIVVKRYDIDSSLRIVGIAAPVRINYIIPHEDSNRVPEYFYLYDITDTGCFLVADLRWDTATPRRMMEFVYGVDDPYSWGAIEQWDSRFPDTIRVYFPVYEAFFYKPITISDSFYVGASMFNNVGGYPSFQHPITEYFRWMTNLYPHGEYNHCSKVNFGGDKTDFVMYSNNGEIDPAQTDSLRYNPLLWGGFGCIFPIFDTLPVDTTSHNDTCLNSSGFRMMDIDNESVILGWNPDGNSQWEISLCKGDTAVATPENGAMSNFTETFASFYYLDTAWYTAYVRTRCGDDLYSDWSEPVTFHFPPIDTATTTEQIWQSVADRYTILQPNPAHSAVAVFSSFQIREVDIFSLDGKKQIHQDANGISAQIDISTLPPATYIVCVKTRGGTTTKKLIKQ